MTDLNDLAARLLDGQAVLHLLPDAAIAIYLAGVLDGHDATAEVRSLQAQVERLTDEVDLWRFVADTRRPPGDYYGVQTARLWREGRYYGDDQAANRPWNEAEPVTESEEASLP